MRDLKEKASVERIKAKQEARLVNLEKERDWFRKEALDLDKMNKDHKQLLARLKQRLEQVSEDKEFLHDQLVQAKTVNKSLMYELDIYKQKFGDLDGPQYNLQEEPFKAIEAKQKSCKPGDPDQYEKRDVRQDIIDGIFKPTAVPDFHLNIGSEFDLSKIQTPQIEPNPITN